MTAVEDNCSHQWQDERRITQHAWIVRCRKCGATTISTDGRD